jgi:uncharacterized protein (TIGR02246 family)
MHRISISVALWLLWCLLLVATDSVSLAVAQENRNASADERAIRAAASEYIAAGRRGDREAMKRMWAPDGDYMDAAGRAFKVSDLFAQPIAEVRSDPGDAAPAVPASSLRLITPDVAIEDGVAALGSSGNGNEVIGRFTTVWVKRNGRWQISSLREAVSASPSTNERLEPLAWLLGEWIGRSGDAVVLLSSQWSGDGNYILREFLIRREGQEDISATQRIGWDASAGEIRSWTFDSLGGSGEGSWRRDGDRWVAESQDLTADGKESKSSTVYIPVADGHFQCEAKGVWDAADGKAADGNLNVLRVDFKRALEDE